MQRRRFLTGLGTSVTLALAGCAGDDNEPDGGDSPDAGELTATLTATETAAKTETQTETPAETSTETPTPEPEANYSLSVEGIPDSVEIGEEFTYGISVSNDGDGARTALVKLEISTRDNNQWATAWEEQLNVAPGETRAVTTDPFSFERLGVIEWRFTLSAGEDHVERFTTEVLSATRAIGSSYVTPNDIRVQVSDINLKGAYEYTNYRDERDLTEAPDGKQWLFVWFEAENQSNGVEYLPFEFDVVVVAGNQQYDSVFINKEENKYNGGEVQPDIVRSGWIAYEVPDDLSLSDLEVVHSGGDFDGNWRVKWQV